MAKKLIIGFLLVFLPSNMIMIGGQNKLSDESKALQPKSGFTIPYLAKEFEKKIIQRFAQNDERSLI